MSIILRPYQTEARYQVNTLLNARRNPCLVIPTGGGKTKTAIKIIDDRIMLHERIWVLCPQVEIFDQWLKDSIAAGHNPGTIDSSGIKGKNRSVYICMPQSLVNMMPYISHKMYPDLIITDEAHHSSANTWESIYQFFDNALRLGLTATPKRTDGKGLDHIYTDIVETTTMRQLISSGHLAEPLPIVPEEYYLDEKIEIKNGDYDPQIQASLLGKTKIIGNVIQNYERVFNGLPILVACSTFEHAEMMTEAFNNSGWRFAHIHSNLANHERKRLLRGIKNGSLNGLCTVGIGIEGLDIPGLYGLIWLRRTLSLTIYLQFIGRVLRPMEGKKYGIILDPVGNTFIHGFPDAVRKWSLSGSVITSEDDDERPTMKICPNCGVMNAVDNIICHFCSAEFGISSDENKGGRKLPAMIDGELIALDNSGNGCIIDEKIKQHTEKLKLEIKNAKEKEAEEEVPVMAKAEKMHALKGMVLKDRSRSLFQEAVKDFL